MMLKIAYLGEKFHGFAKQPGRRTVEGDLLEALEKIECNTRIYPASRTDRGVSALSNVIQVGIRKDNVCRILTALLEDIWVYGYNSHDWNPRHGLKHYIYFLAGEFHQEKLEKCCNLFSGIHDFSAFTRGMCSDAKREIQVSFQVQEGVTVLHFTGKSFLWEMIRRCVNGMKEYMTGKKTEQELTDILERKHVEKIPPAPSENLLLADIEYEFSFFLDQFSVKRMQREVFSRYRFHLTKRAFFEEMLNLQEIPRS